ncbi:MAG TPA: PHB depolymerase family esterase [Thermoanaerobaculia bacterium]|nr:PHB depolymerase family esterase [Thermoanaerobaculia bacterium]
MFPLGLATGRDALLYVPRAERLPLVLMLHGAGGNAERVIQNYRSRADEFGFMILAPDSRGVTWDLVHTGYGPDVRFIDGALAHVFNRYDVDPHHLAIAGFSDGASYALSLGITNGDLFSHVIAFSPGFASPASQHGAPRMFISHGSEDTVLPIQNTKRMVSRLQSAGYDVRFEEFRGPHRRRRTLQRRRSPGSPRLRANPPARAWSRRRRGGRASGSGSRGGPQPRLISGVTGKPVGCHTRRADQFQIGSGHAV